MDHSVYSILLIIMHNVHHIYKSNINSNQYCIILYTPRITTKYVCACLDKFSR